MMSFCRSSSMFRDCLYTISTSPVLNWLQPKIFYSWESRFLQVFYIVSHDNRHSKKGAWETFLVGYLCVWLCRSHIPAAKDWFWFSYLSHSGVKDTKSSTSNCILISPHPLLGCYFYWVFPAPPCFFRMQSAGTRTRTPNIQYLLWNDYLYPPQILMLKP